jgi:hypothetical protein
LADLGTCEWCDRPAKLKIPIMKKIKGVKGLGQTGMVIRCCYGHEEIAREAAKNYG